MKVELQKKHWIFNDITRYKRYTENSKRQSVLFHIFQLLAEMQGVVFVYSRYPKGERLDISKFTL